MRNSVATAVTVQTKDLHSLQTKAQQQKCNFIEIHITHNSLHLKPKVYYPYALNHKAQNQITLKTKTYATVMVETNHGPGATLKT